MNTLPAVPNSGEAAAAGIVALLIVLGIYLVMGALAFASYILTSLSLYTIGSRRLIKNSWLSWLPIGREWVLGSIADEYDGKNGVNHKWRKILLTLDIIGYFGIILVFIVYIVMAVLAITGTTIAGFDFARPSATVGFASAIIAVILAYIASFACLMAVQILSYICYFKLYESTVPKKAVKYLLISLLVPFGMPICLYKAKDQGYMNIPEFLQPPVAAPVAEQPATEETQETVEQPQEAEVVASEPEQAVTEPTEHPKED